ncbi:hypothetical protein D3C84_1142210 [compost metagenome]
MTGSLAFGSTGGSVGVGMAMLGCAVVLGTVTGGPGALACAVIGGGVGGYYGGEIGGKIGESSGEVIYEFLPQ